MSVGVPRAVIRSVTTVVPEHVVEQDVVRENLPRLFAIPPDHLPKLRRLFDNAAVRSRHSVMPLDELMQPRTLAATSRLYAEHSRRLGLAAASACLDKAEIPARRIDLLITVSCTGVMIPGLDALVAHELGMAASVGRLPIMGLGCAGGAAALRLAHTHCMAHPGATVLVVAVELPSLTLQRDDVRPANLVATAIFGDGAAAVLVTGQPSPGPEILASASHLFPSSLATMGFDLLDGGLHIVLAPDVAELVEGSIREVVDGFLAQHGIRRSDLRRWVLHPGGRKILRMLETRLELQAPDAAAAWAVLARVGNVSSASVLFVLEESLRSRPCAPDGRGLLAAFGPGFAAELILLGRA